MNSMSELVIAEFKFLLIEELVCTYNMHVDEAKHAVQKSVVNKMLQKAPEYIMHQALEDSAQEVWNEYNGIEIEV